MFAGLKRAARAIFVDDVRIRRDEQGLRIVLESGPPTAEAPMQREHRLADERRTQQVALIQRQLGDLFETVPGLRQHLLSLAQVEKALSVEGLNFLDTIPLPLLKAALRQFEDAVVNWSPEGLAYLRSRMAVALRERGRREGEGQDAGDARALPAVREIDSDGGEGDADEAALLAAYGAAAGTGQPAKRP